MYIYNNSILTPNNTATDCYYCCHCHHFFFCPHHFVAFVLYMSKVAKIRILASQLPFRIGRGCQNPKKCQSFCFDPTIRVSFALPLGRSCGIYMTCMYILVGICGYPFLSVIADSTTSTSPTTATSSYFLRIRVHRVRSARVPCINVHVNNGASLTNISKRKVSCIIKIFQVTDIFVLFL